MRVLIIKTSSLGDAIHTLPALSDATHAIPKITFDWVIEETLTDIPQWHPNVKRIISIPLRRWRREWLKALFNGEILRTLRDIRLNHYDLVIDAQGLMKSALLTWLCRGKIGGYDRISARESMASIFYQKRAAASWEWHAVDRTRTLFASLLNYPLPDSAPDYGIAREALQAPKLPISSSLDKENSYCVFLQGTTWSTKLWPESHWIELGILLAGTGLTIRILHGNAKEHARAQRLQTQINEKYPKSTQVMSSLTLQEIAALLINSKGVISIDTGLGHLAAALNVPTVSLYGATNPSHTGLKGKNQLHLQAQSKDYPCSPCLNKQCKLPQAQSKKSHLALMPPCMASLQPQTVAQTFLKMVEGSLV